jgi:hypothetical protein
VTGQKLFSGAKASYSGPLQGALDETFSQLPQTKLIRQIGAEKLGLGKKAPSTTKKGEPTLYTHDVRSQLSSILGLNERDFSPKAAEKLANTEHHVKKGRRKARRFAQKAVANLNY